MLILLCISVKLAFQAQLWYYCYDFTFKGPAIKYYFLYFRGTLISRKFSPHILRPFNLAIGGKKQSVCLQEIKFREIDDSMPLFFFLFIKLINNCNKTLATRHVHYEEPGQDGQSDDCTKDILEDLPGDDDWDAEELEGES